MFLAIGPIQLILLFLIPVGGILLLIFFLLKKARKIDKDKISKMKD